MAVAEAGRELGISGAPTLRELASLTPTPWDGIFAEHRRALLDARAGDRFHYQVEPRALAARTSGGARSARRDGRDQHRRVRRARHAAGPLARVADRGRGDLTCRSSRASTPRCRRCKLSSEGSSSPRQNVANANTDGYTRQRLDLVSVGAPAVSRVLVEVRRRRQRRSSCRTSRAFATSSWRSRPRSNTATTPTSASATARCRASSSCSTSRATPGLAQQLSDFWSGFDDVANHPEDTASRTQLLERATDLGVELQHGQRPAHQAAAEHTEPSRRDRDADQQHGRSDRAAEPHDQDGIDRRQLRERAPRPARPAREQAGRAERRNPAFRQLQPGERRARRHESRAGREGAALAARLDGHAGRDAVGQQRRDCRGHVGYRRRPAHRGQQHDSRIHPRSSTPSPRPCATRSTRCTAGSRARSPSPVKTRAARAISRSGSRSTAAPTRRSRSPAPTGRARAAPRRCKPRCRPRSTRRSVPATRPSA